VWWLLALRAVLCLMDCAVLCWNSPCFDLRSGTPIAVEGPCWTLSGCRILHPTSHFSGFKGLSGSGRFTSCISRVGLGISSYVGLNFRRLQLCPCFGDNDGGVAATSKIVSTSFRAFKAACTDFQVMISSRILNCKTLFFQNSL